MTDVNENIEACLKGAYDLHIHPAPDVMQRSGDDIAFAEMAKEAGMSGFAIKSHYVPTADRAYYARKMVPGVDVIGTISLNNSVGGINPLAVDIAGRSGARLIWLPTVDSLNESLKKGTQDESKLPYWAKMQKELESDNILKPPVKVFGPDGEPTQEMEEVIGLLIKYKMILATGHLAPDEGVKIIKYARELGLDKIVITHPEFPTTFYSLEQQKELCSQEVFFERCYTTPATGKIGWDYVLKEVHETGPERNILSTDLGQKTAIFPVEGLRKFVGFFIENGLPADDVRMMTADNTAHLLR